MTTLLLLISAVFGQQWITTFDRQYIFDATGATFIEYRNWNVISPDKWFVETRMHHTASEGALPILVQGWIKFYDLRDLAALSREWRPANPVTPPVPAKWIGYTVGGKVHLYIDCRYIAGKDSKEVEITPESDICLTCIARIGQ